MEFEWDEGKRQRTLAGRGLDFADLAEHFDWDAALYRDDLTAHENRTQAIGHFHDPVVVVVFTLRDGNCRIISLRKAEPRERRIYER